MPEVEPITDSWKSRAKDSLMLFFAMSEVEPSALSWKLRTKMPEAKPCAMIRSSDEISSQR